MSYFTSQTGNIAISNGRNDSTSGKDETKDRAVFNRTGNAVFHVLDNTRFFSKDGNLKRENHGKKEELTKEEEEKFYKKAFETGII